MQVLLAVSTIAGIIGTLGPIGLDLGLKIKHLLELGPDVKANVTNLAGEAVTADDEAMQRVADWAKEHGLPAPGLPPSSTP